MKQNITLALDKLLLKRVRAYAAARGVSVSGMLSEELLQIVERGLSTWAVTGSPTRGAT